MCYYSTSAPPVERGRNPTGDTTFFPSEFIRPYVLSVSLYIQRSRPPTEKTLAARSSELPQLSHLINN